MELEDEVTEPLNDLNPSSLDSLDLSKRVLFTSPNNEDAFITK